MYPTFVYCDYCTKLVIHHRFVFNRSHYLKCCDDHLSNANRDALSWLHVNNMALVEDLVKNYDLPISGLSCKRSDGSQVYCKLVMSTLLNNSFIRKIDGDWFIKVIFVIGVDKKATKYVKIKELFKNDELLLIELEDGLYKKHFIAHLADLNLCSK